MDAGKALSLLRNASWSWLILASLAATLIPLCCTYRWLGVLRAQERTRISFSTALRAVMLANVLNAFLPSKSGDMAKALYLKRRCGISTGIGTVIVERLVDFSMLGMLGIAGFFGSSAGWGLPAGCILLGGATLAFLIITFIPLNFIPLPGKVAHAAGAVRSVSRKWVANPGAVARTLGGSFGNWCLAGFIVCTVASALHRGVNWGHLISVFPLAILAGLVPVTISGIGTRDAAFVVLLTGSMPREAATLVGIGYTFFAYWFVALLSLPWVIREIACFLSARENSHSSIKQHFSVHEELGKHTRA